MKYSNVLSILLISNSFVYAKPIRVFTGDQFLVPRTTKNLAILGSTPHPTALLKTYPEKAQSLSKIKLSELLDEDDLLDSFKNTLEVCKKNKVDELIIAYLPSHGSTLHKQFGTQFKKMYRNFFTAIVPQIKQVIKKAVQELKSTVGITLIVPSDKALEKVPKNIESTEERIQYYIKEFPTLKNINKSALDTITVINNSGSDQNDAIIRYLHYDYLHEKPLNFVVADLEKERFHAYKT